MPIEMFALYFLSAPYATSSSTTVHVFIRTKPLLFPWFDARNHSMERMDYRGFIQRQYCNSKVLMWSALQFFNSSSISIRKRALRTCIQKHTPSRTKYRVGLSTVHIEAFERIALGRQKSSSSQSWVWFMCAFEAFTICDLHYHKLKVQYQNSNNLKQSASWVHWSCISEIRNSAQVLKFNRHDWTILGGHSVGTDGQEFLFTEYIECDKQNGLYMNNSFTLNVTNLYVSKFRKW